MTVADSPLVSVVVLSYNRPHLLGKALDSIAAQTYANLAVTVVDNRSPASEETARVVKQFPRFELIAAERNLGFTGGMNLGLKHARGEFVFLTEDDMILHSGCIAEFVAFAAEPGRDRLLSGLIRKHGTNTLHYAGGRLRLGGIYRKEILGQGEEDRGQFREPFEVDYVTGAMVFARSEYLRQLGGFRDDFFMYFEDVELSLRAARSGLKPMIVPAAAAEHVEPPSGPTPAALEYHKQKNFLAVYLLHAPARVLPEFLLRYGPITLCREVVSSPRLALVHILGWTRTMFRLPWLWRDRRRMRKADPCV